MSEKTIIGITGRTGSGKSLACKWINTTIKNVEHIDCDNIGHHVLEMSDVKPQLCDTFGEEIQEIGKINRSKLRKIVFTNKQQLLKLNNIVHLKFAMKLTTLLKQQPKR